MGLKLFRVFRTSRPSNKVCRSERKGSISRRDNKRLHYSAIDKVSLKNAVDSYHKNENPEPIGFRSQRKEEPSQTVGETSIPRQDPTSEYQCDLSAPFPTPREKKAAVGTPRPVELDDS
jgi:hypothetical protein